MKAIHLIERKKLFARVKGSQTEYESGYWSIAEAKARELTGAYIYFHERQNEPSFSGGVITGIRVQKAAPYKGRIVFRFDLKPECRGISTSSEGWNREKKITKEQSSCMQNAVNQVISRIEGGFVFDSHFVIREIIKHHSDVYIRFAGRDETTAQMHGRIAQIIQSLPSVAQLPQKAWSENIHGYPSECALWHKRSQ